MSTQCKENTVNSGQEQNDGSTSSSRLFRTQKACDCRNCARYGRGRMEDREEDEQKSL